MPENNVLKYNAPGKQLIKNLAMAGFVMTPSYSEVLRVPMSGLGSIHADTQEGKA